ncbi:MAG: hypothetical protein K2R93_09655 [Gemmatimonadaceae bacterium]|nr:hypothetical protein [Gemmatimonadaceae bacterium]
MTLLRWGRAFKGVLAHPQTLPRAEAALAVLGGAIAGFASQSVIARNTSKDSFGQYLLVLGVLNIAQVPVSMELGAAATRFARGMYDSGDRASLESLTRVGLVVPACICLLLTFIPAPSPLFSWPVRLLAAALLFSMAATRFLTQLLAAFSRQRVVNIAYQLLRPAATLAINLYLLRSTTIRLTPVVILLVSSTIGAYLALVWISFDTVSTLAAVSPSNKVNSPKGRPRDWLAYSMPLVIGSVVSSAINTQIDTIVVGKLLGASSAATYGLAAQIALVVALIGQAIVNWEAPKWAFAIDRAQVTHSPITFRSAIAKSAAVAALAATAVSVGSPLVPVVFGQKYADALPLLFVLLVGQVLNAGFSAPIATLLNLAGYQRRALATVILSSIAALGLSVVMTLSWGVVGTALAVVGAACMRAGVLYVVFNRSQLHHRKI